MRPDHAVRHDASVTDLRQLRNNRWIQLALLGLVTVLIVAITGGAYWYLEKREVRDGAIRALPSLSIGTQPLTVTRSPAGEPTTVTFIGDSISNGWAATTYADSYVPKVIDTWNADGPTVAKVEAISGKKLWEVGKYAAIDPASRLVVIELGTNDVRPDDETDIAEFRRQYDALIGRIQSAAPDAAIVCLGTWRPANRGETYDRQISAACGGEGMRYLRLSDIYQDADSRGPEDRPTFLSNDGRGDNFHPNDAGYTAIAQRITDNVQMAPST